jgi:hypothetical protein
MTLTLYVLLAAGAVGAPADDACPCNATAPRPAGPYNQVAPASSGGVFGWMRNLLGQRQASPTYQIIPGAPVNNAAPALTNQPMRIQPVTYSAASGASVTTTRRTNLPTVYTTGSGTTVTSPRPSVDVPMLAVAKKYEDRVGHERDYSWVTGHLFFTHADGGRWVVRYALPDEIDRYGGSIILAPGVEMRNYREGDLVCVYGDVLDESRSSRSLGGALYRVNVISLVDRNDP